MWELKCCRWFSQVQIRWLAFPIPQSWMWICALLLQQLCIFWDSLCHQPSQAPNHDSLLSWSLLSYQFALMPVLWAVTLFPVTHFEIPCFALMKFLSHPLASLKLRCQNWSNAIVLHSVIVHYWLQIFTLESSNSHCNSLLTPNFPMIVPQFKMQ